MPELGPDDALVKVAGCGVCHTDLSFFYDGVPTVNKPPLTLGHEISGTVVAGPGGLVGKNVIVPAVMPCNKPDCPICAFRAWESLSGPEDARQFHRDVWRFFRLYTGACGGFVRD